MYVNLLLQLVRLKSKLWLVCFMYMVAISNGVGQSFFDDAIVGDDEACPELSNNYYIKYDLPVGTAVQWYIDENFNDAGGQIIGDPLNQTSIDVEWSPGASGYTRLILFGSYIPIPMMPMANIAIQDTITIHVDKDLNRLDLNCEGFVGLDFGPDCERYIDINEVIGTGTIKCEGDFEFTLTVDNHTIPNPVPQNYINKTIIATITHIQTGTSCSSTLILVDGSPPELICSNDTILCSDPRAYDPTDPTLGGPEVIAGCNESYSLEVNDYEWVNVDGDPFITGYIKRTWRVTDAKGNTNDCCDTIFLKRIIFDDIVCPQDTMLECTDSLTLLDPFLTGTPTFDGQSIYSDDPYCKIYVSYKDYETPGCGSGKEVERVWRIISFEEDGQKLEKECVQTISIVDTTGPELLFNPETYVSEMHDDIPGLNPNKEYPTFYKNDVKDNCQASGDFPLPMLMEDCSPNPNANIKITWGDRRANGFSMDEEDPDLFYSGLLVGKHMIVYESSDECWNQGLDTIVLVLKDKTPPNMVLDLQAIITITDNDPFIWANAEDFDEGTKDNCGMKLLLARRVDWKTACGFNEEGSVVRAYYDEAFDYYQNNWGDCIASLAEYGWSEQFPVCCEDVCVDGGIWVEFMAIDEFCNYSKLVTRIQVEDKSVPEVVTKLPDLTMNCYTYNQLYKEDIDQGNYDVFGAYVFNDQDIQRRALMTYECSNGYRTPFIEKTDSITDGLILQNCQLVMEERIKENISSCGEGWIERTFVISNPCMDADKHEPILTMVQKIYIEPDCQLRSEDFIWPTSDTTIYACDKVEVALDSPILVYDELWRTIGISHKDVELYPQDKVPGLCHKILRSWTVGDWCADDPYYLPKYDQYIYIKNVEGPKVLSADIEDICINTGCTATFSKTFSVSDDCTPVDELNIIWRLYKWSGSNKSVIASGINLDIPSTNLEIGRYSVVLEVEDHCNNSLIKEYEFGVSFCSAVSFTLPSMVNRNITASQGILSIDDIDYSISLPCNQASYDVRLQYKGQGKVGMDGQSLPPEPGVESLAYSCNQIGNNVVELWVVDAGGVGVKREFTLNVADPYNFCPNAVEKISGTVRSANGEAIKNVMVKLMANDTDIKDNVTSDDGQYDLGIFPNVVQSYKVKPEKEDSHGNGISILDVLMINRMVKGQLQPSSPYEAIAADVNEDGNISVFDVLYLQSLLLNRIQKLPGDNWMFFNSEMKQISVIDPTKEYKSMLHFVGVKKGDVNSSAKLRSNSRSSNRNQDIRLEQPFLDGVFVKVPVFVDRTTDVSALQLSLINQNSSSFLAMESGSLEVNENDYHLSGKELDVVWIRQQEVESELNVPHFYLVFDSQDPSEIDVTQLKLGHTLESEVFVDESLKDNINIVYPQIKTNDYQPNVGDFYPNPFGDFTKIDFNGDQPFVKSVEVFDVSGRRVFEERLNTVISEYSLSNQQLGNAGFYTVRFNFETSFVNKKLYLIK